MRALKLTYPIIFLIVFTMCEKVEIPIPEPEVIVTNDSIEFPTVDTSAMNASFKKTLVEEFTGHKCITCPFNTKRLLTQLDNNPIRMIVVAHHAGGFAQVDPPKYPTDFNTEYGTEFFTYHNMSTQPIPSAVINSRAFSNFGDLTVFNNATTFWEDPIDFENTNSQTDFAIGLAADYNDSVNLFYIQTSIEALSNINGNFSLVTFCVEDSVVAPQLDGTADENEYPGKIVTDYVHRHVMRKSLSTSTSLVGDNVISGGISQGEWIDFKLNAQLPENIVDLDHMIIVSMLIDEDTEEIVQSEEVHVHVGH